MRKVISMKNKKAGKALDELLTRSEYLVVQANDLAKSFGNLRSFEHRILDYCFSFVQKDSRPEERFALETSLLLKYLNLTSSGTNYERVVRAFKALNENTAIYLPIIKKNGTKGIKMTQLFAYIDYDESGLIEFEFSKFAQPYVFDLKKNFYSFHLRELANIRGKYSLILLKLWESHRYGENRMTFIGGDLKEWQNWFLGEERDMSPGIFKRDVLTKAVKELEQKFPIEITLTTIKKGRNVTGYEMEIMDSRKPNLEHFFSQKKDQENFVSQIDMLDEGGIF